MIASRSYIADTLRLAGPVAVARLGIIGMALADVIVVGQLAPHELPHQALGLAPPGVFLVTSIGLLMGVQVLAARALGQAKSEGAGAVLRRGLVLALAAGFVSVALLWLGGERLFTAFGIAPDLARPAAAVMRVLAFSVPPHLVYVAGAYFLEAIKKPAASTAIMWCANGVNLALNLAWVPQHGAIGSAWATVGARIFLAASVMAWIWFLRDGARFGVRALKGDGPGYGALLGVGVAAAVSQAVEAGAFSSMTVIAARVGAEAVSTYQILLNLLSLIFMVALGMSTAAAVLVSEAIGRGAPRDAARAGWTGLGLNTAAMLFFSVLFLLFPAAIGRAYTADLSLAALVSANIWVAALVLAPDGAQVVAAAALRARGDAWFPTFSHIFAYAVVMPVLGYWLGEHQHMGAGGLMLAIFWASAASGGVLVARWGALTLRRAERARSASPRAPPP
jgi:MATE family, multidrug efflux pump